MPSRNLKFIIIFLGLLVFFNGFYQVYQSHSDLTSLNRSAEKIPFQKGCHLPALPIRAEEPIMIVPLVGTPDTHSGKITGLRKADPVMGAFPAHLQSLDVLPL